MSGTLLDQVKALPVAEQVQLAQEIWETLVARGFEPELTPAQAAELDRRLAAHAKNPDDVVPCYEIRVIREIRGAGLSSSTNS